MNGAHIHLMINHVPVLGTFFGLLILLFGQVRNKPDVVRIGFGVFVIAAFAGGIAYLSGERAEEVVEQVANISDTLIEPHEDAAWIALIGTIVLGVVSLGGLIKFRKSSFPKPFVYAVLVLALAMSGWMGYTANLGGKISHPEIRSETVMSTPAYDNVNHDD